LVEPIGLLRTVIAHLSFLFFSSLEVGVLYLYLSRCCWRFAFAQKTFAFGTINIGATLSIHKTLLSVNAG
ncbi:hypothetical protein, partial [Metasolibacillus meyeri]|uniref:hypothetical protein n=1 Tax=Metasolibacillus meyeri TaxID=1071052 RepID=UPI001EE6B6C3